MILTQYIDTPLGIMISGSSPEGICLLEFSDRKLLESELKIIRRYLGSEVTEGNNLHLENLRIQLEQYFSGKLREFSLPLVFAGTDFQKKVWDELLKIPYGSTRSYKEQALKVGNLLSIRAVGTANGMNKIAIVVPCHRVIGEDGSLTGFGGGLWRKKWLLDHEKKYSGQPTENTLF